MKISSAFPSKYLKASDLPEAQHVRVQISHVEMENVAGNDNPDENKPVLYFENKSKGMVLNKTNAQAISQVYGDDTDDWTGKFVSIYATETLFQGKMTPCLRVTVSKGGNGGQKSLQQKVKERPAPESPIEEETFKEEDIPF